MNNIDLSGNTKDITNDKIEQIDRIDNTPYDDVLKHCEQTALVC